MTAQRLSIQTSAELPVENLYNQAINGFIENYHELAKLPQDPNEPLLPLNAMLRDIGVDVDNDASMFILGAIGKFGSDMAFQAMGMATDSALSAGIDIASNMLMEASESASSQKEDVKNGIVSKKSDKASVFMRKPTFRRAGQPAPSKQPTSLVANTRIMKRALTAKKAQAARIAAPKRKQLRAQMAIHEANIKELLAFKSCGVKYAHRITVPNGNTGEFESYLVAAKDKPELALTDKGRRIDVSQVPTPAGAYPAPRFGMAA